MAQQTIKGTADLKKAWQQRTTDRTRPYNHVSPERMMGAKKFAWNCMLNDIMFPAGTDEAGDPVWFSVQDLAGLSKIQRAEYLDKFEKHIPDRAQGEAAQLLFTSPRYALNYRDAQQHLDTICQILDSGSNQPQEKGNFDI